MSSASVWVVIPEGRLDASVAPKLEQALSALERRAVTQKVLSFCHTRYFSSSSLASCSCTSANRAMDAGEEEVGQEPLAQTAALASDQPCADIVHSIHAAVSQFVGDQPQFDDYTLVAVKRKA